MKFFFFFLVAEFFFGNYMVWFSSCWDWWRRHCSFTSPSGACCRSRGTACRISKSFNPSCSSSCSRSSNCATTASWPRSYRHSNTDWSYSGLFFQTKIHEYSVQSTNISRQLVFFLFFDWIISYWIAVLYSWQLIVLRGESSPRYNHFFRCPVEESNALQNLCLRLVQ